MKNNKKTAWFGVVFSTITLAMFGCSKGPGSSSSTDAFGNFDTKTMLTNIGTNILQANVYAYTAKADSLSTLTQTFVNAPTAANLTALQSMWVRTSMQWAVVAPNEFGPLAYTNTTGKNIDYWPINTTLIKNCITSGASASDQGASTIGLKALEYLMYDSLGNAAVLTKYTTAATATNQKNYLLGTAQALATISDGLKTSYSDTYISSFVAANGNDVTSSVGLIVNALSIYLDVVKNMKIGNSIGMGVKINDGAAHADQIEYPLSNIGLDVMRTNISAMKTFFNGGTGSGLDDLLAYRNGTAIATSINAYFDSSLATLNTIKVPMGTAIVSQKTALTTAYTQLKQLLKYLKVDAANNLGVSITFTDNDGD